MQVAVVLGIVLAVLNREDPLLAAIAVAGVGVALVVFWRDCRGSRDSR